MSHEYTAIKNKHQKYQKAFFEQYLYNSGEPQDNTSNDIPPELEAELLGNSPYMRRRHFRHIAQRIRRHNS